MGSTDDKIVVAPFFGNLGKYQRGVAGSDHDGVLLHVVGALRFGKSCGAVNRIEQKIIGVRRLLTKGEFIVTGIAKLFYIERKSFCNMTFFHSFPCGFCRERTVRCSHGNTPKSAVCYLCNLPNDIIAFLM